MTELIISEKPKAAQKIAAALADGKVEKKAEGGISYYTLTRDKKEIIVVSTVGHIYSLTEKEKKWEYPRFDVEWKPIYEISKNAAHTKKYLDLIKKLAKKSDTFTVACDYDVEGETIGLNIIRFACKKKDAQRMKFSTLTEPDLINAYKNKSKTIDWGMAKSGLTRHELDWYYGINVSRALMTAIKKAGSWKILSAGRVQGPSLKLIVDKEKEIQAFIPVPFWEIELVGEVKKSSKDESKNENLSAWHSEDKIFARSRAEEIMQKIEGKKATVKSVERSEYKQAPPVPFDLTTLQTEAYRCFKSNPKETLDIAQSLYTDGIISYPRTSSQQLPEAIGFKKIIQDIGKQEEYSFHTKMMLKGKLVPNNGKKTDPAHPAIYPTGIAPKKIDGRKAKVYDLIVRRFLATFGESAIRETMTIKIDVNSEIFIAKGSRTKFPGWHEIYKYVNLKDETLPDVKQGELVKVKDIVMHDKETQPPKRYTQASIVRELESRNLGTKSTRATVVQTLYDRHYVMNDPIQATDLGISTSEILEKYIPEIVDEELTRNFEVDMDQIQEGKKEPEQVFGKAKDVLTKVLERFKKKEKSVGEELLKATKETRAEMTELGKCNKCSEGNLVLRKGRFGLFVACNKYPECKNTFALPSNALIKPSKEACSQCGMPTVLVIRKAKQPQEVCISPECSSKKVDSSKFTEKRCPRCKLGNVKIRPGFFGEFAACDTYPKCRYTEKVESK